jgi:pimeloyl-ACP methyl ester carboxylesterase
MSLGGNVAFHFVATHLARALSLTMVDIGPRVDFGATANMRAFVDNAIQCKTFEELVAAALKASPRTDPDLIRYRYGTLVRLEADGFWSWRQDRRKPHDFEHILGKLREMPSLVQRVTCPVLIARGGRSRVISNRDAREFAAMFGNGTAVTISEAGHNIQEDNPKELATALRAITKAS